MELDRGWFVGAKQLQNRVAKCLFFMF